MSKPSFVIFAFVRPPSSIVPNARPVGVVCVDNGEHEAFLERRKIHRVLTSSTFEQSRNLLRVIDEAGEPRLYSEEMFVGLDLPPEVSEAFARED